MQTFVVEAIIDGEVTTRLYQGNRGWEVQLLFKKEYPRARFIMAVEKEVWNDAIDHALQSNIPLRDHQVYV